MAGLGRLGLDPGGEVHALVSRVEADVQPRPGLGGDDVGGAVADIDGGDFKVGRLEAGIAVVQHVVLQGGEQVDQDRDRIGGTVRIGDVTLPAFDRQPDIDRATAADLDHVAEGLGAGGLADDAVVDDLALGLEGLDHHLGAVGRHAFLVAGDQEGERALHLAGGDGLGGRRGEGGHRALHVDRAAADQHAVDDLGGEGLAAPRRAIAHRDHVGVAGEAEIRPGRPVAGVKVLDLAEPHPPAGKAEALQGVLDEIHRARVGGGDGGAADEFLGQADGVEHGPWLVAGRGRRGNLQAPGLAIFVLQAEASQNSGLRSAKKASAS